jgi:uroporphyrin-III C-methyltransferase
MLRITLMKGCKLASRIRREIASCLPPNLGETCNLLGSLRAQLQSHDGLASSASDDDSEQSKDLNSLIIENDDGALKDRRIRWLSQICEYYPLNRLVQLSPTDIKALLDQYRQDENISPNDVSIPSLSQKGTIALVGAGPGHPDLLTQAALRAINTADLVLADKLVPSEILSLIPRRTEVHIARKFPGNAEKAQEELQSRGLLALQQGKRVVRLKTGDPYIFGRGGEEYLFFQSHGYKVSVIPGVTSALAAPALAGIPSTHRGVADRLIICTGTGRKGALPQPPEYSRSNTVVFLMSLHRIDALINSLESAGWSQDVPCVVIERASCRDQRIIRTRIKDVVDAVEQEGSRPPGLLVVGWACSVLYPSSKDERWTVEEGISGYLLDNLPDKDQDTSRIDTSN